MTFDQSSLPFEYVTFVVLYENGELWYHLHDNEHSIFGNQHFHHKETHHSWILPFTTLPKLINLQPNMYRMDPFYPKFAVKEVPNS